MLRTSYSLLAKSVLVFGSGGAMGRDVATTFAKRGWTVIGVDVTKGADTTDIAVPANGNADAELRRVVTDCEVLLAKKDADGATKFDAVVNAAGGWAGGGAKGCDIAAATDLMWSQSVKSSVICSHVAINMGTDDCLLVLTGAAAALNGNPTPGMLAYGTAKAAVHHITKSVAAEITETNTPMAAAVCVCPVTIDTPGNRAGMPGADTSSWTPLADLSDTIAGWADKSIERPKNGSLIQAVTKDGKSSFDVVN